MKLETNFDIIARSDVIMEEIERTKEFIEHLVDAEEMISGGIYEIDQGCPVGIARKKIIGLEKNFKITKIDPKEFRQNPYIKNIQIGDWMIGNIYLSKGAFFEDGKLYVCDARKRDPKSLTAIYEYGYFPENVNYPSLGTIFPYSKWMGVEPGEINTFASFIEEAKGKVLLMGCGLGYVAYMLSLKEDVEEITIVELDPSIKKMFEMYLKPQMNHKINIVLGDAIEFLERENLSMYQYCSVDIWHGVTDMLPFYLKCLLLEQRHPKTKFHYWLEEDLHKGLESAWIQLLKPYLNKEGIERKKGIFIDILNMQSLETVEDVKKFITAPKRPIIKEWALQNSEQAYNHENTVGALIKLLK